MYLSEKSRSIDLYKNGRGEMMIRVAGNGRLPPEQHQEHQQMIQAESSGDNQEVRARKKRAEAWVQEETRSLISFRKELDGLFNTTKSNKHLWKQISAKMREKGFNRSPPMCTEKWRNLLKEFKKAKHHQNKGSASAKISYYKELDLLLKYRNKNSTNKSPTTSKVDSFQQFSDRGLEDASIPLESAEASGRPTINLDGHLDHDRHSLAITAADAVAANGVPPWNWRDTSANGGDNHASYGGRVISIKWGEYTKKIGIDGTAEAIKDVINSAFGLRTRTFWLEDEDEVVRTLDRDMPLGTYILHLDEGVTIKICTCDSTDHIVHTEEMTLYGAEDFRDLLTRRGWTRLRDLNVVYRSVQTLNDLRPGGMYQGLR